ncbi:hypothetical protein [Salinicoccus bachuensis]|uniref:Uncharacterized protein n=1 Tax=Salinicoccus bachuensis TaxID=3136731 RepID=A0ABZ3IE04_9STAP
MSRGLLEAVPDSISTGQLIIPQGDETMVFNDNRFLINIEPP